MLGAQLLGAAVCIVWTSVWTAVIRCVGINISAEVELQGLDICELGEHAYDMMEEAATAELMRDPTALAAQLCTACASGNRVEVSTNNSTPVVINPFLGFDNTLGLALLLRSSGFSAPVQTHRQKTTTSGPRCT
jgi:hypothetical protein